METTCALIKPGAVAAGHTPAIIHRIYEEGFVIVKMELKQFTMGQAYWFYDEHRGKPFYDDLVAFMASGPLVWLVLERRLNAVAHWRTVIGATDPAQALPGTLRYNYGTSLRHNAVHGSASEEAAKRENYGAAKPPFDERSEYPKLDCGPDTFKR